MKRALIIIAVTVFVAGGVISAAGAGGEEGDRYKLVFDNAFGLVEGADFKVGGVPVGSIEKVGLHREDARALVTVNVSRSDGFGGLRSDAHCMIAPQSLIGEYFVDCEPGERGEVLQSGATLPVENTESPIPPDLVLNVMRRPERERFAIILGELGAGLAARGDDLNETLRRSLPAIRSTNEVLAILEDNRRTLQALARDSGRVLSVLGRRRDDVGRFVTSAADLASTTAERRAALAETFRRFPGFLDELTPTMVDLGTASRELTPTLADLRAAAPTTRALLDTLRPFSRAAEPATEALGDASRTGLTAARESQSLIARLAELGEVAPEPSKNLRIILDDLDDRDRAVEDDPDSPGGEGYTGLEAPLQYIFDQALALNIFDQRGYSLKLNLSLGECSAYTNAEDAKAEPERYATCNQNLGPNQPAITTPDPSPPATPSAQATVRGAEKRAGAPRSAAPDSTPAPTGTPAPTEAPAATPTPRPLLPPAKPVQDLLEDLPKLLDPLKPLLGDGKTKKGKVQETLENLLSGGRQGGATAGGGSAPAPVSPSQAQDLLDFLLAP